MDPNANLRQIHAHLATAKRNRDSDNDDSSDIYEALDLALSLLRWLGGGGFQPEQLAHHADKLRELLP